jgi:hypothetical protein
MMGNSDSKCDSSCFLRFLAFRVTVCHTINKRCFFEKNPALTDVPYRFQSPVSLSISQEFDSALEGNMVKITDAHFTELEQRCEEFGLDEFGVKLSEF